MQESATFRGIVQRAKIQYAQETLILQGTKRFGEANEEQLARLQSITDLERLTRMTEAILRVKNWQSLLATR